MASLKRKAIDPISSKAIDPISSKAIDPIVSRLTSDVMHDLNDIIPSSIDSVIVCFQSACTDDNSCIYKKGYFTSIESAMNAINTINSNEFKSDKDEIDWYTSSTKDKFEYYVEERKYFIHVTVENIKSSNDLEKIQTQFRNFFELSKEEFERGT